MASRIQNFLLFLLFLLLPSQLSLHLWPSWSFVGGLPVDYLSPALYLTDIILLALLAISRPKLSISLPIIILCTLNVLFSISPLVSLYKWLRLLEYFWLFKYLTYSLQPTTYNLPLSLSVLWTSLLAWGQFLSQHSLGGWWYWLGERPLDPALPGIAKIVTPDLNWLTGQLTTGQLWLRPYATMSHPNALAGFLLVSALVLKYFTTQSKTGNWLLITGISVALATVPVTFSRSVLFLEIILLAAWVTAKISNRLLPLIIPLGLALTILLLSIGNPASFSERLLLTKKSISAMAYQPIFGLGLGTFPIFSYNLQRTTYNPYINFQPVHNIYLLAASELGLPALVLIVYWLIKNLKNSLEIGNWLLIIPVTVVLVTGLVDHYWLTSHQNLLLLTILFSLVYRHHIPRLDSIWM